jgi:hypothetical protein
MTDDTNQVQPRWRLGYPLLGYLVGLFLSTTTASVVLGTGAAEESVAVLVAAQLGLAAGLLGAVFLASSVLGTGNVIEDFKVISTTRDVAIGAAAGSDPAAVLAAPALR